MKVFVVHDVKGNIRSVGVPGTPGQTLAPESGKSSARSTWQSSTKQALGSLPHNSTNCAMC